LGIEVNVPDEGVDLDGIDIIQLLEGLLDLPLVRLDVDMKTRVLFSSIFFIALSVLSGWTMTLPASRRG